MENLSDRFATLKWLIDRYDVLRVAISRRAAIVLSADAIMVTATVFIFDKFLSRYLENADTTHTGEKIMILFIVAMVLVTISLLSLSILSATHSIVNVWKKSHELLDPATPRINFFHARDTYEDMKDFSSFKAALDSSSGEDMVTYAEAELWRVTVATYHRHNDLKRAIQLLVYGMIPFLLSMLVFSFMVISHVLE